MLFKYLLLTVQMRSFAHRMCVCVCERERERERESHHSIVCVYVCQRERDGHITVESAVLTVACVQTHMSIITVSVTRFSFTISSSLRGEQRTLLTVFTFILKAEVHDYGKGRYISDAACVRQITMHCASWPIRADCACRKEELCRKPSV